MEFEHREISEERCKEINSWKIHDPYPYSLPDEYDRIFTAEGNYFVTNEDESILFCHAFTPRHEVRNEFYDIHLFIKNKQYYFVRYKFKSIIDDRNGPIPIRKEEIVILEEKFIEESKEKKELFELLKALISKYEEEYCRLDIARITEYHFKFYYKGEEI